MGLWSSVVMGLSAPLLGSRAGVISGTAAVVIVPLSALTTAHGVEYMTLTILVSALLQGLFGVFGLASAARLVSEQVLSGFLNALGVILLLSQASIFKKAAASGTLGPAASMAALCFGIVQGLPRLTRAVPSSLVGLVVASGVGAALDLPLETLASGAAEGTFAGGLASLPKLVHLGDLWGKMTSIAALKLVLPAAVSIMIIAVVETLLAGKVVDDMTGQKLCPFPYKHPYLPADSATLPNSKDDEDEELLYGNEDECVITTYDVPTRSVLAMSAGNTLSALLGGFGGCGLIPQTVLNIKSGGGGKYSSLAYATATASFVVLFAPLVGKISQAALAGIMITVAADTVAWGPTVNAIGAALRPSQYPDARTGREVDRTERFIELFALGLSSYVCYFGNLAAGIIAGVASQSGFMALHRRRRLLGGGGKGARRKAEPAA